MIREQVKTNCIIELVNRGMPLRIAKMKVLDLSIEEVKNLIGVEIK
tara:strand:- start:410 stop:547 length:138 start_codon:yes stop_codon:yes gene_type:complete